MLTKSLKKLLAKRSFFIMNTTITIDIFINIFINFIFNCTKTIITVYKHIFGIKLS